MRVQIAVAVGVLVEVQQLQSRLELARELRAVLSGLLAEGESWLEKERMENRDS